MTRRSDKKNETVKKIRLDEIAEKHIDEYATARLLINKIGIEKLSIPAACRAIGWKKTIRTAYNLWAAYQKNKTLTPDQRWFRKPEKKVLTEEVQRIIKAFYHEFRAAGPRAIHTLVSEACEKRGLRVPAEITVRKFLDNLSISEKLDRQGAKGLELFVKNHSSVIRQNKTTYSNEIWQGDDCVPLKIWTRRKINGIWVVAKVYGSAIIDDFSRANPGFLLSHNYPNSWTVSLLLRDAIMSSDIPELNVFGISTFLENDQGANWISEATRQYLQSLGTTHIIDPAYYPNSKGKVEAFFRYINSSLLKRLPGHFKSIGTSEGAAKKRIHELLTIEQLRNEIDGWRKWYHTRERKSKGETVLERWQRTVRLRYVESEDELNVLLLKYDRSRVISNQGVKLTIDKAERLYWHDCFDMNAGLHVNIRYNPESMDSILLYNAETSEFLCEAWDFDSPNSPYTLDDVKRARNDEKRYVAGIAERNRKYYREMLAGERLPVAGEWEETKKAAAKLPKLEELPAEDAGIEEQLEKLRQLKRKKL